MFRAGIFALLVLAPPAGSDRRPNCVVILADDIKEPAGK